LKKLGLTGKLVDKPFLCGILKIERRTIMLLEITDQRAKDALTEFIEDLDASIYSDANILAMLYSLYVPQRTICIKTDNGASEYFRQGHQQLTV
jgi:hypothetical protein